MNHFQKGVDANDILEMLYLNVWALKASQCLDVLEMEEEDELKVLGAGFLKHQLEFLDGSVHVQEENNVFYIIH